MNKKPKRDLRKESDSLTIANKDIPWIKRYLEGNALNIPDPYDFGSGKTSTHGLSYHPLNDSIAMIYPEIIQQGDSLVKLDNDAARKYAEQNNTGIITDLELAKYYSENGLIQHAKGGKVAKSKIYIKPSKRGSLRKATSTPKGKNIPASKLKVKPGDSKAMKKKKIFAQNARKWKHAQGGTVYPDWYYPTNVKQFGIGGKIADFFASWGKKGVEKNQAQNLEMQSGIEEAVLRDIMSKDPNAEIDLAAFSNVNPDVLTEFGLGQEANQDATPDIPGFGSFLVANQYAPTFCRGGRVKKRKMPYGGVVDSELVELEDGEPFRTPDGTIGVTKKSAPTHKEKNKMGSKGVPVALEVGTEVLGKKVDPDTKMKYKELGSKLAKQKKKYDKILESNKGTYSMNAAKAMSKKLDDKFTTLFQKQERGKKGKTQTFQGGGTVDLPGVTITGEDNPFVYGGYSPPGATPDQISGMGFDLSGYTPSTAYDSYLKNPTLHNIGSWFGKQNWGGLLNTAAQLAPVGYNLIQGMRPADHLRAQDYYNPQYGQAIDLMMNRRYDVSPELQAAQTRQAISDYNTRTAYAGMGSGAVASNVMASRAQRARDEQAAYARKQNIDLGYMGQEAAMRARLGGERAGTDLNIDVFNQQSDAARRNMLGTGFGQLSQWAQMQQFMGNQQGRDAQRLDIMRQMYPLFFEKLWGGISA